MQFVSPFTLSRHSLKGVGVAAVVLTCWFLSLALALTHRLDYHSPFTYLWVLLQTHLYTGLFITSHDAMHGTVAPGRPRLNNAIGWLCAGLFAFNNYGRLKAKHGMHHAHVATEADPDYYTGGFWRWYLKFALEYISVWQLLAMAITFNVLYRFFFPVGNVLLFWVLPSLLSTLQLFYFGTYLPHRGTPPPPNVHKARSQRRGHVLAFFSCYFFGYHYEHHDSPATPWWRLPTRKTI